MITVYFGAPDSVNAVRQAVRDHAAWLERPLQDEETLAAPDCSVYAGWDPETVDDHYRYFAVCPSEAECRFDDRLGEYSSRVLVHLTLAEASLRAEARLGSTVQLQYARLPSGWLLTDDIRILRRLARWELDPVGVHALLKFGTVPAPNTVLAGVSRIRQGDALVYDGRSERMDEEHPWLEMIAGLPDKPRARNVDEARERLVDAVDGTLRQVERAGVLLYSGGIDSSLLAVRLAALGRTDVRLAHLEFDYLPDETTNARALADHLGLEMVVRTYEPAHVTHVLGLAAREWPYPFTGPSAVPTHAALDLGMSLGSRVLVEGTASEVLAAKTLKWGRRSRLRSRALATAVAVYRRSGMWHRPGFEKLAPGVLRAGNLAANLPAAVASLVPNTLDGLAYSVPRRQLELLSGSISALVDDLPAGPDSLEAMAITSMGVRRSGRYATKLLGPLSMRGASCSHPFMSPAMLEAVLTSAGEWSNQHKPIFKAQLASQLPAELATRRPSTFMPRLDDVLAEPAVREAAREAVAAGQPLAPYVHGAVVEWLLAEAAKPGGKSHKTAGSWLWGLAFCHRWLRGTEFA